MKGKRLMEWKKGERATWKQKITGPYYNVKCFEKLGGKLRCEIHDGEWLALEKTNGGWTLLESFSSLREAVDRCSEGRQR